MKLITNDDDSSADCKLDSKVKSNFSESGSESGNDGVDPISYLDNAVVIAYTAGRMRKHRIRISLGDKVKVAMNPYDMTRARITYRFK
ncbi:translation initiation factor IF-1 [Candidatus Liberibacter asiaticus]|uniref:translation initiation factor IF-1 n=1 Tax=Liberibacter asiaticus TaxID=34021 RepID=UPI001F3C079B|nr:translation initiation factor IF-1 [Candidatus Liberibacter asiaticus]MCU7487992.1 translation initiation factor IF-1 [Candidatus Liberibacter asiaticus]MCU7489022.1 translation initiation factor IF-1 [Candidatus Liberibacter asiaticus]MDI1493933.1 translation initiation factor IF-1 [Candidatus Liberibacter asiaticus]WCM57966.1 translation initiation factor IF-1 [Candidatus Liberibacter asiaticus]WCM58992.1 translation initiation factor IF-1 [Candidatus Liberibacter asiaticus]